MMLNRLLSRIPAQLYLALLITLSYLPFLPFRVIRTAGDEKVYLGQAAEMVERGTWFYQTLSGIPEYFKGPLHFWLVRFGMNVFGDSLLAGLWMNWFLLLLSSLAVFWMLKRELDEERALLIAGMSALNLGVYAHVFASQMEIEVVAGYLATFALLGSRSTRASHDYILWAVIGATGWAKSPFHSVLLGGSTLLFWLVSGELLPRLRQVHGWLAPLTGVGIGALAFVPAAVGDPHGFWGVYIRREQFNKAPNGWPWYAVITPLFHFATPWFFLFAGGLVRLVPSALHIVKSQRFKDATHPRLALLCVSLSVPTLLVWASWSYKGQNYNLPILAMLLTLAVLGFSSVRASAWTFRVMAAATLALALSFAFVLFHMRPLPDWWSPLWLTLTFLGFALACMCFAFAQSARGFTLGGFGFFLALSSLSAPVGEHELDGMRVFMREHPDTRIVYAATGRNIFNEWALMRLALKHPFGIAWSIHDVKPLIHAQIVTPSSAGLALVTTMEHEVNELKKYFDEERAAGRLPLQMQEIPWKRWLTKGRLPTGEPMWKRAWEERNLSLLEKEITIFLLK